MRQLILLPILFAIFGTGTMKADVCTPSLSNSNNGSDTISCIKKGQFIEESFSFKLPDSIQTDSAKLAVEWMIITEFTNLPCGISWASNKLNASVPPNKFLPLDSGCVKFKGSTDDSSGIYEIGMATMVKFENLKNPINGVFQKMAVYVQDSSANSCPSYTHDGKDFGPSTPDSLIRASSCATSWPEASANVKGRVFKDGNGNSVQDNGETGKSNWIVKITPGPVYATTDSVGNYSASLDPGSYTVSLQQPNYWNTTTNKSHSITIDSEADKEGNTDFGVEATSSVKDLRVDMISGLQRQGEESLNWISFRNVGTEKQSATLSLNLDSNLTFSKAVPSPSTVGQDKIEWNVQDLKAGESRYITLVNSVANKPESTALVSDASIAPKASDTTPSNNTDTLVQWITSSSGKRQVAPTLNDKISSPRRKMKDGMSANYTRIDEELEYTVRFQNTSEDEASQVIIKDTLDKAIDVSTFELMAASHEVDYDIKGKGIITFTFEDINLPASNQNELGSKGFVKYSVEAKDDVQDETKVHNNAGIYFDYNKSIVTNTTQNTMVKKLPSSTSTSIESANAENITGYISPNPFNESFNVRIDGENVSDYTFELYNMMGKKLKRKDVTDSKTVNVKADDLSSGMYLYTIKLNDGRQSTGKIIAK